MRSGGPSIGDERPVALTAFISPALSKSALFSAAMKCSVARFAPAFDVDGVPWAHTLHDSISIVSFVITLDPKIDSVARLLFFNKLIYGVESTKNVTLLQRGALDRNITSAAELVREGSFLMLLTS